VRLGITILTDLPWAEARPRWTAAEEMGFDHAWTYDHLVWGGLPDSPWRSSTPTLAAAAAVTSAIGLGTFVASPNFRHPYLLWRDAQALDDVSGGRFLLGVGAGGDLDSRILGGPDLTPRQRADRFREFVAVLGRLRAEDHVDQTGEWFSLRDARTLPRADVPLLVAGKGPRSVRYAAHHGDGWVTTGPKADTLEDWWSGLADSARVLEEALADADRDAAGFQRHLHLDSAPVFSLESADHFEEVVGRAGELGFTDAITHWPRPDGPYAGSEAVLEQAAREVLPRLR